MDERRRPGSSLVDAALGSSQGEVGGAAGPRLAAVVANKDDDGVVVHSSFLNQQSLSDISISFTLTYRTLSFDQYALYAYVYCMNMFSI